MIIDSLLHFLLVVFSLSLMFCMFSLAVVLVLFLYYIRSLL